MTRPTRCIYSQRMPSAYHLDVLIAISSQQIHLGPPSPHPDFLTARRPDRPLPFRLDRLAIDQLPTLVQQPVVLLLGEGVRWVVRLWQWRRVERVHERDEAGGRGWTREESKRRSPLTSERWGQRAQKPGVSRGDLPDPAETGHSPLRTGRAKRSEREVSTYV